MDCIQCKIVNGEIPSYKIYEDEDFLCILDIYPSSMGHCLIIPKSHNENLFDLDEKYGKKIIGLSQKIGKALMDTFNCDGLNILQNNGEAAGQSIFHYHMHLIPRYDDDNVNMGWRPLKPNENQLNETLEKIKENI